MSPSWTFCMRGPSGFEYECTAWEWKWKWKWRDIRPSMVTHTQNLCSAFNPSKEHTTQQWTYTHREHTPGAVGSHLCCGARGAVGGLVPCSRAPQSWYWRWRERCTFTPHTYNSCRTWDSNLQPLGHDFPLVLSVERSIKFTSLHFGYKKMSDHA